MRNSHLAPGTILVLLMTSCGPAARPKSEVPAGRDVDPDSSAADAPRPPVSRKGSETRDWSEVPPTESSSSGVSSRKSRIVVNSDPIKHGSALHFRFHVNAVPISGIFVATGGVSTTFTIPVGTVHFTVDECSWEMQGFDLAPEEEIPISCKLTKDGDCCEVALPADEDDQPAKKPSAKPKSTPKKQDPERDSS